MCLYRWGIGQATPRFEPPQDFKSNQKENPPTRSADTGNVPRRRRRREGPTAAHQHAGEDFGPPPRCQRGMPFPLLCRLPPRLSPSHARKASAHSPAGPSWEAGERPSTVASCRGFNLHVETRSRLSGAAAAGLLAARDLGGESSRGCLGRQDGLSAGGPAQIVAGCPAASPDLHCGSG